MLEYVTDLARPNALDERPVTTLDAPACRCGLGAGCDRRALTQAGIAWTHDQRRARQTIYRRGDVTENIIVICSGWACRYNQLSDGRRQILSILLPGDIVAGAALFSPVLDFSVQALTAVRYGEIARGQLRERLSPPAFLDLVSQLLVAGQAEADAQLFDLGRRLADERVAALVLRLRERLLARGEVQDGAEGGSFAFPLRQQQVADIVGLTPEHVSRVVTQMRRSRLMDIADGFLTIHDLPALKRLGDLR